MMKLSCYCGSLISSYEIDGTPHADMSQILTLAIPGSWDDYSQVLNSSNDMIFDLDIKCIDEIWLIPVTAVSTWLFTFKLSNKMGSGIYERFRVFRRDIEKTLRVAWALPVDNLMLRHYEAPYAGEGSHTIWDIANIFLSYGLRDEEVEGTDEGEAFGPLHYIEYIAGSTSCGSRGHLLCDQIQYIEDLPNGSIIFDHINEILSLNLVPPTEYLDEYLDDINTFISLEASRFVGEI